MSIPRLNELDSGNTYNTELKSGKNDSPGIEITRTLLFSLVCQHRTESNISDTLDVLHASVELGINDDSSLVVNFNSNLLQIESGGEWSPSNSDKNNIRSNLWYIQYKSLAKSRKIYIRVYEPATSFHPWLPRH